MSALNFMNIGVRDQPAFFFQDDIRFVQLYRVYKVQTPYTYRSMYDT